MALALQPNRPMPSSLKAAIGLFCCAAVAVVAGAGNPSDGSIAARPAAASPSADITVVAGPSLATAPAGSRSAEGRLASRGCGGSRVLRNGPAHRPAVLRRVGAGDGDHRVRVGRRPRGRVAGGRRRPDAVDAADRRRARRGPVGPRAERRRRGPLLLVPALHVRFRGPEPGRLQRGPGFCPALQGRHRRTRRGNARVPDARRPPDRADAGPGPGYGDRPAAVKSRAPTACAP